MNDYAIILGVSSGMGEATAKELISKGINIYGIDIDGNFLDGFPVNISGGVVGSIVVSDLDNDGIVDACDNDVD